MSICSQARVQGEGYSAQVLRSSLFYLFLQELLKSAPGDSRLAAEHHTFRGSRLMIRSLLFCAALVGATSVLRAGELDGDKPAPKSVVPVSVASTSATELDGESPTAAHRYGGWGYGRGYYGGGWGYGGGYGGGYYGGGWGYGGGYGRSYYGGGWGDGGGWGGYGGYASYYGPSFVSYSSYGYYGGNCW